MQQPIQHISFGECVKSWSYERFMVTFSAVYPDADLERYAKGLGLVKLVVEKGSASDTATRSGAKKGKP